MKKLIVLKDLKDFTEMWVAAEPQNRYPIGPIGAMRGDVCYVYAGDVDVEFVDKLEEAVPA